MAGTSYFSWNISGTGMYVPEKILNNFDLEKIVDTSDEWIRTRTGMFERRIAADNEAASDLAYNAAIKALESAHLKAKNLQYIFYAPSHFNSRQFNL